MDKEMSCSGRHSSVSNHGDLGSECIWDMRLHPTVVTKRMDKSVLTQ